MTIPDLGSDLLSVVARTAIVYICLVIGFRILGKREAGQLSTIDLVVLLVIANAVQNAMVGQNTSLLGGLVAAAVILVLDIALHWLAGHWRPLGDILIGEPTLLVEHGRILEPEMEREGISHRELAVALRQNQLMSADEAEFVFLETNGMISVIPWRDAPADEAADDDRAAGESSAEGGPEARRPTHPRRRRRLGRLTGMG
ncbi:MAG TPA: YetF domain-containing protein [Candidatus Limnocylindrales bacterium]|nr:YetF domain-containing protein [Candidatus Limnocylindrales bacterium]